MEDEGGLYSKWGEAQAEEAALMSQLQQSRADEMSQAHDASRQHTAFLQLLQLRMRMQPAMAIAARCPATSDGALWGSSAPLRRAAAAVASEAAGLLSDLCSLRHAIWSAASEGADVDDADAVASATAAAASALSGGALSASRLGEVGMRADDWWHALEAADASLSPWVDAAVEELSAESAANAAGGHASSSSGYGAHKFKAVRQGPLTQAEHLLAQMPPGSEARDAACHQAAERVLGVPETTNDGAQQPGAAVPGASGGSTAEVYDDAPFYHSLLKQLLDDSGGSGGGGAPLQPKLKHTKKPTDNRRSKGRKLSYEVQSKLLNFMFPEIPERPVILSELFASVFGQRTSAAAPAVVAPQSGERSRRGAAVDDSEDIAVTAGSLFG